MRLLAALMAALLTTGAGVHTACAQSEQTQDASGPGPTDAPERSLAQEMLAGPSRTFLPMPLYRPLVVPQQEAPGVVVSEPETIEPPQDTATTTPVALSVVPQTQDDAVETPSTIPSAMRRAAGIGTRTQLRLSHYAFGAYQRGLYSTAFNVALRASAQDDAAAAALIGRLYEEAKGVDQDLAKAAGWYAVAADLGDAEAQSRLAAMLLLGRGVPKDAKKAADVFQAAAERGSADAAHALALLLLKGEGREQSMEAAFTYMKRAAEAGDATAQYALAIMYDEGQGIPQDDASATQWFGRAAEAGDPGAAFTYAIRLLEGIGAAPDAAAAAPFLAIAARSGNPRAMNAYAKVLIDGPPDITDETEAIKWHLMARAAGISDLYLDGYMASRSAEVIDEARRRANRYTRRAS